MEEIFDKTAVGWVLRVMFFPSGFVCLLLVLILLKRSEVNGKNKDKEGVVKKAARYRQNKSSGRRLSECEIERVMEEYLTRRRGQEEGQCGICLGRLKWFCIQLPCGHYHHGVCMKEALRQDVTTCADCGWNIKTLFEMQAAKV